MTFIQAICHKSAQLIPTIKKGRKNVGPNFFQDYPNAIRFDLVHLWPSMFLFLERGGQPKKIGNWGGVMQFSNYTPPKPTSPRYPIKNERSLNAMFHSTFWAFWLSRNYISFLRAIYIVAQLREKCSSNLAGQFKQLSLIRVTWIIQVTPTEFEPIISAMPVRCSPNWATKPCTHCLVSRKTAKRELKHVRFWNADGNRK